MVDMAESFNRSSIKKSLIEVRLASGDQIPYSDRYFDWVYAVHTLYLWNDPPAHLQETHRVCRERARFVLAFGPKEDERAAAAFPGSVYTFYSIIQTRVLLSKAGFHNACTLRERIGGREIVFALGHRWCASGA